MGRIAVVSMPFASARRPSLQVGLLTALARQAGWTADGMHLNVEFAELIGRQRYEALCQHRGTMLSEWLFSLAAFGNQSPDLDDGFLYDSEFGLTGPALGLEPTEAREWLRRVRRVLVPAYLERLSDAVAWGLYDVVAFTSTFQQNVASFALCRTVKANHAGTISLFGGANFDGVMGPEYVRAIDCIDYAAVGEADRSFSAFLHAFEDGSPECVPGICHRAPSGEVRLIEEREAFAELDSLPTPDYDDYFARCDRLGWFRETSRIDVDLPFESARGCWWGQKHHCIFCGLNSQTMSFRSKSPSRVVAEVEELSRRYGSLAIEAVDNILDLSYLHSVMPQFADSGYGWNLFYETKSNLSAEDLEAFARAGVRRIQPGIESLSTPLLQRMRKGVTGLRNVNLLRWCRHFGISVSWNLLWGFPGETAAMYEEQLAMLRAIPHLQPPDGEGRLWLERFSPMFTEPSAHDVCDVRPLGSYEYVYPASLDLAKAAYFFEYTMSGALPNDAFDATTEFLADWRREWNDDRPYLFYRMGPGFTEIREGRPGKEHGTYRLSGEIAAVMEACARRPVAMTKIAETTGLGPAVIAEVADALQARDLVAREGSTLLALAVPA